MTDTTLLSDLEDEYLMKEDSTMATSEDQESMTIKNVPSQFGSEECFTATGLIQDDDCQILPPFLNDVSWLSPSIPELSMDDIDAVLQSHSPYNHDNGSDFTYQDDWQRRSHSV
jgi:hypothetical protein